MIPQRLSPSVGVPVYDRAGAYKPQDGIHNPSAPDYSADPPPAATDAFLHGAGYWRPRDASPPGAYGVGAWALPVKEVDIDLAPRQLFAYRAGGPDPSGGAPGSGGYKRSPELAARLGDRGASELSSLHAVLQARPPPPRPPPPRACPPRTALRSGRAARRPGRSGAA